jgi:hypothetical protein
MGRVEWVTFQEPESHSRVGGGREGEASVEVSVEGQRRETILAIFGRMRCESEVWVTVKDFRGGVWRLFDFGARLRVALRKRLHKNGEVCQICEGGFGQREVII